MAARKLRLIVGLFAALVAMTAATGVAGAKLAAHGSAHQVYGTGLKAGRPVGLLNARGTVTATRRADRLGGVVFRLVPAAGGYRVRQGSARSGRLTVFTDRPAPPSTRVYGQKLAPSGYGYLTTRDGTKLAYDVHLPAGPGPYPTLVEYSGYGYADPVHGPDKGIGQVANVLGFAVVDVNMRGTGCSAGSFDFFEALQSLDGYDVIETVARQSWVMHHRVGMLGISYGGISQLFVGATNPPHLAAIAPLSVLDNSATTLDPGGILNTGFTLNWASERVHDAKAASATGGQPWALAQIQGGDQTCKSNQALHGEAPNLIAKIRANRYYTPAVADPVSPLTFVKKIHVPVYLACQWTDEQTGGHCADLASHFTGTRRAWFTFANGDHVDSLDPATFNRWYDFLELYVAGRTPHLSPSVRALEPAIYQAALGISGVTLPADPIQQHPTYAAALNAFQHLAPVRILFDNGAGSAQPGYPYAGFERSFARFPIPGTQARSWYLGNAGGLSTTSSPERRGADRFHWSKNARPATDFTGPDDASGGGLWLPTPNYHWLPDPPGTAAAYVSPPVRSDTTVIGAGAVHLWVKASTPSVDLQVTLSELRPDGKETYVQSGWLRADERKLDPAQSTLLAPVPSFRAADVVPLPTGRFTEVTDPLFYEGHVYRRGSRIRLTVSAPGGDQPVWGFAEASPAGGATVTIAHSTRYPARVILPVVPGVTAPTPLPPCPGLRGEPCRPYTPYANTAAGLG